MLIKWRKESDYSIRSYQQVYFQTGVEMGWDTFYAKNTALAQIIAISTAVKKDGKSAV